MSADEVLTYECTNDDCRLSGQVLVVPQGASADCPNCGWSLMGRERYEA